MINSMFPAGANNDAELVHATLSGNRDAFGQIVTRYQSLICSLAYSATGSLAQSEDLAQETFVTAWKQLRELREPEKLRAWLCGIARNLINNSLRKQGREPSHAAESIEEIPESHSAEPPPTEHVMSDEEQNILWRSLEKIPETYREPLVLFYREHQSVEAVAEKLELTPEAVHQRLSRGRKLLAEEVTAFVEGALRRTNPGKAFTLGVLAALPVSLATSAKAASVAVAAAKSGATATGATFASVLGLLAGPALGLIGGYIGMRSSLKNMRTPRERAFMLRYQKLVFLMILVFMVSLLSLVYFSGWTHLWQNHPGIVVGGGILMTLGYVLAIFSGAIQFNRKLAKLREEERALHPEAFADDAGGQFYSLPMEYRSRATLLGLPLVHCRTGRLPGQKKAQPAIGWIAFGEVAYGILFANGAVAVGGISVGGASVGIFSFGGFSVGLLAFGGFSIGAIALGGAAIGILASGGIAIAWHAATGGLASAHDIALGGAALGLHANDSVAREFFALHHWLDISQRGPLSAFWFLCFAPVILQMVVWNWLRKKLLRPVISSPTGHYKLD